MEINLLDQISVTDLLKGYDLQDYKICDYSIGNDDLIHILLAENIPEREQGMFVSTKSNTHYRAISLVVDWQSGGLLHHGTTDFGALEPNLHFIQRLGEGFLLLGARAHKYKDGSTDKNALVTDSSGIIINQYCLGDGIQQCMVDEQNRIITSYFDEGIFGNYGWDDPIGSCGLILWSARGERIWENRNHDICDCYAINLDESNHLWFYYYTDFNLVKTDYKKETVYQPDISGSGAFLLNLSRDQILFDAGYKKHGEFVAKQLHHCNALKEQPAAFVWNGQSLQPQWVSFRGSKALLWDQNQNLYYIDWALSGANGIKKI